MTESPSLAPGGGRLADDDYKTFLFSYQFGGSQWSFELKAKDWDEAVARYDRLSNYAHLDGELMMKIPVSGGWLAKLIVAWKNWRWVWTS